MKRHGNLFERISSLDNLRAAYLAARKGKSRYREVQVFERNTEGNLLKLQRALRERTFTTSAYRSRQITEPKRRTVYTLPFFPDRIVQHALVRVLEPIWEGLFIADSYACRRGRGMHAGSRRVMGHVRSYGYVLKADISKFYPSIRHDILLGLLRRKIKCEAALWLLEDIVRSFPGGRNVPIGNYTSQWFGNLYLNELDTFVKHELKVRPYVRYCDDFVLFSDDKRVLNEAKWRIEQFVDENLGLRFSRSSVAPVTQGVDFLGYRHWPNKILARKSTARRAKRRIASLLPAVRAGRLSAPRALSSLGSTQGWLQWCDSFNLRRALRLDEIKEEVQLCAASQTA